ncbi:serine hydrolase domain-containing protein [Nocardiopsis trehalosi]|uniref:serine hydrolase domain-containing protein n=1 Tax=Nocardiopsis trehalosi TaxID=109329 RepID=UPI000B0FD7D1|nr:serine hydrolase domain-containing protein [Nocardiopsis trehalosi]
MSVRLRAARAGAAAALAAAVLAPVPALAAPPPAADTPVLDAAAVDAYLTDYLDSSALNGAAVAVTRGTEVVHTAGYGTTSGGDPMGPDTPMGVASVSKSFTALAVMRLVEEGRVDLDTPVRAYLPEFPVPDPRADGITVRHLLTHTSGMSDAGFAEKSEPQPADLAGAVARLEGAELVSDPGAEYHYTNPNYHVAARLVEVVSGRPFAAYLDAEVFTPLGMDATRTVETSADATAAGVPEGHVALFGQALALPEPHGYFNGAGGVVTTADDMAAWLIAQNNEGVGPTGERVLSAEGVAATHTGGGPDGGTGLGWNAGETDGGAPLVEHGGIQWTFTAYQMLLPDSGYGIAVMADSGLGGGDAYAVAAGLAALAEGAEPPAGPARALLAGDVVLLVLGLGAAALGVRGVRRSGVWARRRAGAPVGWAALRCLPPLVPVAVFASAHRLAGFLTGGRDMPWSLLGYLTPMGTAFLAVAAVAGGAVAVARTAALVRARRAPAPPTAPEPAPAGV